VEGLGQRASVSLGPTVFTAVRCIAGEISFVREAARWTGSEVSNQSTGYRPDVTSWSDAARAWDDVGLGRPSGFTREVVF
jgi:hypothetical protein